MAAGVSAQCDLLSVCPWVVLQLHLVHTSSQSSFLDTRRTGRAQGQVREMVPSLGTGEDIGDIIAELGSTVEEVSMCLCVHACVRARAVFLVSSECSEIRSRGNCRPVCNGLYCLIVHFSLYLCVSRFSFQDRIAKHLCPKSYPGSHKCVCVCV